jgi:hypothetical protein
VAADPFPARRRCLIPSAPLLPLSLCYTNGLVGGLYFALGSGSVKNHICVNPSGCRRGYEACLIVVQVAHRVRIGTGIEKQQEETTHHILEENTHDICLIA